jgi:hypothetical protein
VAREANPDVRLIYLLRNRRVSTAEVSGVLNSKDTENQGEREVQLLQVILDHELKIQLSTVCSQIEQTGVKYWSRIDLRQKVNSN